MPFHLVLLMEDTYNLQIIVYVSVINCKGDTVYIYVSMIRFSI